MELGIAKTAVQSVKTLVKLAKASGVNIKLSMQDCTTRAKFTVEMLVQYAIVLTYLFVKSGVQQQSEIIQYILDSS